MAAAASPALTAPLVAITLFAALLHATWNAMAHTVSDRLVGFGLIGLAYTVVGGAAAMVLGPPPAWVWPYVLASAALQSSTT